MLTSGGVPIRVLTPRLWGALAMALVMQTMGPMVILFIIYPISILPLRILTTRTTMFTRMPRMYTDGRDSHESC